MFRRTRAGAGVCGFVLVVAAGTGLTQPPGGGKGGFGPPGGVERKLLKEFDKNGDGWLNADERAAARETAKKDTGKGGGKGGKGFGKGDRPSPTPGPKVTPADVKAYPDAGLYDPAVLRTLFLTFENPDWESELQDFHGTDIDVPATLTVDGKTYPNVGVHFRGMSSYFTVPAGSKRSLNLALDLADPKQRLGGYKTLNLLNGHVDPSLLSTVLYSHIARKYLPTPKANLVKVVVNGESWGVYANAQQFNKEFTAENFKSAKGARWKVRGSPGGGGGLEYLGDDIAAYKRRYEIKSKDDDKDWRAFIDLCRTLHQTPPDKLAAALDPILDVDGLLWFLALDVALVNNDGYWVRASDYTLCRDDAGKFHVVPHDMNEAFGQAGGRGPGGRPGGPGGPKGGPGGEPKDGPPGGPGGGPKGGPGGPGGRGPGGGGIDLDPLVASDDARKPLRSKVLAVPELRTKYLANVRTIADESLDWKALGPVIAAYRTLIEKEVEADTRKLDSFEAFQRATSDTATTPGAGRGGMSLRAFAEQRRKFLLEHPALKK